MLAFSHDQLRPFGVLLGLLCVSVILSCDAFAQSSEFVAKGDTAQSNEVVPTAGTDLAFHTAIKSTKQLFKPVSAEASSGNSGLFVGVNRFDKDESLNDLAYAVHDAIEIAYLFAFELKLIPPENCVLLLSGEPSLNESSSMIQDHLEQLRRSGATIKSADRTEIFLSFIKLTKIAAKESDLLVTSFSSHGFEDRGMAYIMPSDGVKQLLSATAVPLQTIESQMQESKAGHRLLLVDACQERISARSSINMGQETTEAFVSAFARPTGQAKFVACSSGQVSFEYRGRDGVGHGLFTHGFLRALRGGARPDRNGIVRLQGVVEFVAAYVGENSRDTFGREQMPFLKAPVSAAKLPLAMKADDLTSLLIAFGSYPTRNVLNDELKLSLVDHLKKSTLSTADDQRLVTLIRSFMDGDIDGELLSAYVDHDRKRWNPVIVVPRPPNLQSPFSESQARSAQMAWAKYLKIPISTRNSIGMEMQLVPPGVYMMGSTEHPAAGDETPHQVTISKPFYVSKHEVTVGQFRQFSQAEHFQTEQQRNNWPVRGWDQNSRRFSRSSNFSWENPGWEQRDDHPVVHVSWNDGQLMVNWLSRKENQRYRFLTEAEWEYCCRGGTGSIYATGNDLNELVQMGNVLDQSGARQFSSDYQWQQSNANEVIHRNDGVPFTASVGKYQPNNLGLFDFHGNICEWCQDWFGDDYHQYSPTDPQGATSGTQRSARGGRFDTGGGLAKSFRRNRGEPTTTDMILGLRLAREIKMPQP